MTQPKRRHTITSFFSYLGMSFVVFIVVIAIYVNHFLFFPLTLKQTVVVDIPEGTSVQNIGTMLVQAKVIQYAWVFRLVNVPPFNHPPLKAGEYQFKPGLTGSELLQKLRLGLVLQHKLTIVEGWTFQQLMNSINENPYFVHTLSGQDAGFVMMQLGFPGESPEGLFFPDTYLFTKGTKDITVLRRANQQMQNYMAKAWLLRAPTLPYQTPYDALKAASLVEKETAYLPERPVIAGVIVSRLAIGMPLQMDPSVIYGLGTAYQGKLTKVDMQTDTPYNNYLHKGLPPTPIAFPSASSIQAVLHPTVTGALYFVAKGDGTHAFSQNLSDQDKAIIQYLLKPNQSTNASKPSIQGSAS